MKKPMFLLLFALLLSACSANVVEVTLYEMNSFSDVNEDSAVVITDDEDISIFTKAVNGAKKQSGIVDMDDPHFKVDIGEESYFLWTGPESGTVMNTEDTHTIYSLSPRAAGQVNDWIRVHRD
ncbi:lipoprotein [Alteribacter keqinensis]|uniref:YhfM-like domain-containing protein n=1 Tax=Alteribacter keqinensis TaxID=2483800 RepID=A0A3M7TQL7_9BACI|nr:hypothetical protein [Alteribacter keqinensis]RNA66989.1 hypothetical protein EBO34_17500 [Alteribacter keqinensis]